MGDSTSGGLFAGVRYYLPPSLSLRRQTELSTIFDHNGATSSPLEQATHIITDTSNFEGSKTVPNHVAVVSEEWVDKSMILGKMQPVQFYSADPSMLFSGVIATATGIPVTDLEVISAGITALGGQWRNGLTKDVTHLFALAPASAKYEAAIRFQQYNKMKVLLPHWFDDVVKLGVGSLPTAEYEWPDPRILKPSPDDGGPADSEKKGTVIQAEKKALYKTLLVPEDNVTQHAQLEKRDTWKNRRILLSTSLELTGGRREAVEIGIQRTGGEVVKYESVGGNGSSQEEAQKVEEADILITRYRAGAAYAKAVKANKTVGTLSWLFHVESTGIISRPVDQLLHYPVPKRPIENFHLHEITVTNYTGDAREYLKKLIGVMGATFTPSMSARNTVVIAAFMQGNKTEKARSWSIPIVNHTWLEDCFIQWRNLTVGLEKYIVFPPRFDFSQILVERGVGRMVADDAELDIDLVEEGTTRTSSRPPLSTKPQSSSVAPVGTDLTARDAKEAEEVAALVDGDGDVNMDADDEPPVADMDMDKQEQTVQTTTPEGKQKSDRRISIGELSMDSGSSEQAARPRKKRLVRRSGDRMELAILKTPSMSGSPQKRKHPAIDLSERSDSDVQEVDEPGPSSRKTTRRVPLPPLSDDGESEISIPPPAAITAKPKARTKKIVQVQNASDERTLPHSSKQGSSKGKAQSEVEVPPTSTMSAKSKVRTKKVVRVDDEGDKPAVTGSAKQGSSKGKTRQHTDNTEDTPSKTSILKRVPSVVISSPARTSTKGVSRTESIRATASEKPSTSPIRPRPIPVVGIPPEPASVARTGSKRSAATKAAEKLREVMPDVLSYEQEMKNARARTRDRSADKSRESIDPKRLTTSKKRPSDVTDHDMLSSGEDLPNPKRRRIASTSKENDPDAGKESTIIKSSKPSNRRSKEACADKTDRGKYVSKESEQGPSGSKTQDKPIRLMTTGIILTDAMIKPLTFLGVKVVSKPSECTHLMAKHIGRTEKLLSAMAVSPTIITEEWADASVKARRILPTDQYLLQDPEAEKKYGFKLAEALRRSKKNGGRLLAQHTFYVTPKLSTDLTLLRNVVTANGGHVLTKQRPSLRTLTSQQNRHIISCPEDASIWRPLASEGQPIYSVELLLVGILKQEMDWDDPKYRVPTSG